MVNDLWERIKAKKQCCKAPEAGDINSTKLINRGIRADRKVVVLSCHKLSSSTEDCAKESVISKARI